MIDLWCTQAWQRSGLPPTFARATNRAKTPWKGVPPPFGIRRRVVSAFLLLLRPTPSANSSVLPKGECPVAVMSGPPPPPMACGSGRDPLLTLSFSDSRGRFLSIRGCSGWVAKKASVRRVDTCSPRAAVQPVSGRKKKNRGGREERRKPTLHLAP